MASSNSIRQEASASNDRTQATRADTHCPECEQRLVSNERETYCRTCGLVVDDEWVDEQFTRSTHGQLQGGSRSWSVERTTGLRVDKALATTFYADTDGRGNSLSGKRREFYQRLRRRHKRFQMEGNRAIRLNEALKDVELIGKKLELPRVVLEDAARIMRRASTERLPGGHMAWESLAGAAVLLATTKHGWERPIPAVARLTKTDEERLCAAARKLRLELGLAAGPVREGAVERVVGELDAIPEETRTELVRGGRELLALADEKQIAAGTPRATAAGAAVYAADRLTSGKALTQGEVAAATEEVLPTTKSKIARYSRRVHDAATEQAETMQGDARAAVGDD